MTVGELRKEAKAALQAAGIDTAGLDGDLLLSKATGLTRVELLTKPEAIVPLKEREIFHQMMVRRLNYEPIQYILNQAEFMGLDFYVNQDVLIPRPDTECLVECALNQLKGMGAEEKLVLDLCTGSGCIGISLACQVENIYVIAADISGPALAVAKKNGLRNKVVNKIAFVESNLFDSITPAGKFHMIISNPPYISHTDLLKLEKNVGDYEPRTALDGGADGLYFYREIAQKAYGFLGARGQVLLEIGYDQKNAVTKLFEEQGFQRIVAMKDLSGHDRVLAFQKN